MGRPQRAIDLSSREDRVYAPARTPDHRAAPCHPYAYAAPPSRASRYSGSRYDGDPRRSRSRDRSPDRYNDRASQYSDGGPRRTSGESRSNNAAFQANREGFRDTLPRDTPRGPRALIDAPSGPRGGSLAGDFRGRGRGRGRGWRDDSRDRGRDRDLDFRDRRDLSYREDRSRERERDWRDRDRDTFRGRRPSPRARSPPGRDFRDARDPRDAPLGVDADRARRGSRDGPLSAGSSNSDPPFGPQSYRGGFGNRGRGRGRGDWDRGRGRPFYDDRDRDRYGPGPRARSQDARYRDRDDRERDGGRFLDSDMRSRESRDDREARERDIRAKMDRTSHEPPPSARDVSPPPIAPAAPSFGSVPNRTPSISEASTGTTKIPPTGPRALKDDRAPAGPSAAGDGRLPPTGPSKSAFPESPPIPSGPRAQLQQRPGPSSKQWINPNLKRGPESPKVNRSQSFAQTRFPGFRGDGSGADQQPEGESRPRSSDAKSESHANTADSHFNDPNGPEPGEIESPSQRRPRSVGSPFSRDDYRHRGSPPFSRGPERGSMKGSDRGIREQPSVPEKAPVPEATKPKPTRRPELRVNSLHLSRPRKPPPPAANDQSSDSDDEEMGDIIETQMGDTETKLQKLETLENSVPTEATTRHVLMSFAAITQLMSVSEDLQALIGPVPEKIDPTPEPPVAPEPVPSPPQKVEEPAVDTIMEEPPTAPTPVQEKALPLIVERSPPPPKPLEPELPQPSIEEDVGMTQGDDLPAGPEKPDLDNPDVVMGDTAEASNPEHELLEIPETKPTNGVVSPKSPISSLHPPAEPPLSADRSGRNTSTPSPAEDEDETDIEEVDSRAIETVRVQMVTPPLNSLPDFDEKPWFEDRDFMKYLDAPTSALDDFIMKRLNDEAAPLRAEQEKLRKLYGGKYEAYLRFTMSDDPTAVKSRDKFTSTPGADGTSHKVGWNGESKPESRRSRYASERDLERILEESRRVEDEKRERRERAEKEKYRIESKEAVLPLQYQTPQEREDDFYTDTTGFLQPDKIVSAWEVLPPVNNFTDEEVSIFEKAYLEFPKQWGKVADPLARRDFGTTIQFYYLKKEKEELNLKEKLKKRPRQRKRGRGKQRSSALVSELGNGDNEAEATEDTGENGERRRPRRAAAPTFNSEATPATDGEATGTSTPGRRGKQQQQEGAVDKPKRGRRAKEKEPKQPRVNQTLAAAPPASNSGKNNRSRSSSRVQAVPPAEWAGHQQQPPGEGSRMPSQYELAPNTSAMPTVSIQAPFAPVPAVLSPEKPVPPNILGATISDVMAPPPLRPEPPQPSVIMPFDLNQPTSADRKAGSQASSYWSVPEATDFPHLLRSFGSDWAAIANHMRTKTTVMVKNYYARQKDNGKEWEALVTEADSKKARGEKLPPPPAPSQAVKKRYDTPSTNRPLASADTVMEDAPPAAKLEQPLPPPSQQSMTGRFNVPIATQPQQPPQPVVQSPFPQPPQPPVLAQAAATGSPVTQPLVQPVTQTMSPSVRPLRAPFGYPEREREPILQQSGRMPLVQKASPLAQSTPVTEPLSMRHPLPGSLESQAERQRVELKQAKEQARQQERPSPLRVKQEPDVGSPYEPYASQGQPARIASARQESSPLMRAPEPPRTAAPAPQAPFAAMLQQQPGRGLLGELVPSPPAPRPISSLSRPMSDSSGPGEPFNPPPAQPTPPATTPATSRPAERKTSSIMSLLNDDPPPPPPRSQVLPAASKPSPTPPPQVSRPPPAQSQPIMRREPLTDTQSYGSFGRNPPAAPSAMPSLKPYATNSPQPPQQVLTPRHMGIETPVERVDRSDYFRSRQYSSPLQQHATHSPQVTQPYPPHSQPPPMPYQSQPAYGYPGPPQQAPSAASPPPQYGGHPALTRSHEPPPPPPGREMGHSRELSREMGHARDMSREMGRDVGRDVGRDMGRELGREMGREMGGHSRNMSREMGRDVERDMGRDIRREGHSRDVNRDMMARDMGWAGTHPSHPMQQAHQQAHQQVHQQAQQQAHQQAQQQAQQQAHHQAHQQAHHQAHQQAQQAQQQAHQQQQQQQQPPPAWPPKTSQPPPPPNQSPWAAQHASTPKVPPPSSSVPPQPSWTAPPAPPRAHDPRDAMNLRDTRDLYSSHHRPMQPMMQPQYAPASRAPEPPPPQTMSGYRYPSTPGARGDPRDTVPARSFTPVGTYDPRGAYPPPDMRDVQLREQQQAHAQMREHQAQQQHQQMREQHQQSILQQHLRPQDRNVYDNRPLHPPDRYGR